MSDATLNHALAVARHPSLVTPAEAQRRAGVQSFRVHDLWTPDRRAAARRLSGVTMERAAAPNLIMSMRAAQNGFSSHG